MITAKEELHPSELVLGGDGLLGAALCRTLRQQGIGVHSADLKSGTDLRQVIPPLTDVTYVWFLAWDVGGAKYIMNQRHQLEILENNVALCNRVFRWLAKSGIPFTFVSSQMVGYPNSYGLTKLLGEHWTRTIGTGLIARLWNIYGPEPPSLKSHVIPDLIDMGLAGNIILKTNGTERRQFLHVDDCVHGLLRQRDVGQHSADITSGEWVTIKYVAQIVADETNASLECGTDEGYEHITTPTRLLDGWAHTISLREGIRGMIPELRRNRSLCA